MNETKLSYVSLVLSSCAIAVSAVTAGIAALGNSSSIDSLKSQVVMLADQNKELTKKLEGLGENRARIDELDIGLTALAAVTNVDLDQLGQAIAVARARAQEQPPVQVGDGARDVDKAAATVAPEPAKEQKPGKAAELASETVGTVAPESPVAVPPAALAGAEPDSEDNPFAAAAGVESAKAPGALAITPEPAGAAKPTTIKEVDAILGKRISENWYKPEDAHGDLTAIIQLKMGRDGKVASVSLAKESGNKAFDASVVQAVHSIVEIPEVRGLSDADFNKAYANRNIQFTPKMGG